MVIFGISRSHSGAQVAEAARRFADRLSVLAGLPVEVHVANDYEQLFEAITKGRTTLAWLPPLLYARAAVAGLTLAAIPDRGGLSFRSAILVSRNSRLRSASEVRDARAAWVDPSSAAGYLFPRGHLVKAGASFSSETFHGSSNVSAEEVTVGRADLSTCPVSGDDVVQATRAIREVLGVTADRLRVLALTEPIPRDGLALSPAAPEPLKKQLGSALLRLNDDEAGLQAIRQLFGAERLLSPTAAASAHGAGPNR